MEFEFQRENFKPNRTVFSKHMVIGYLILKISNADAVLSKKGSPITI